MRSYDYFKVDSSGSVIVEDADGDGISDALDDDADNDGLSDQDELPLEVIQNWQILTAMG